MGRRSTFYSDLHVIPLRTCLEERICICSFELNKHILIASVDSSVRPVCRPVKAKNYYLTTPTEHHTCNLATVYRMRSGPLFEAVVVAVLS